MPEDRARNIHERALVRAPNTKQRSGGMGGYRPGVGIDNIDFAARPGNALCSLIFDRAADAFQINRRQPFVESASFENEGGAAIHSQDEGAIDLDNALLVDRRDEKIKVAM